MDIFAQITASLESLRGVEDAKTIQEALLDYDLANLSFFFMSRLTHVAVGIEEEPKETLGLLAPIVLYTTSLFPLKRGADINILHSLKQRLLTTDLRSDDLIKGLLSNLKSPEEAAYLVLDILSFIKTQVVDQPDKYRTPLLKHTCALLTITSTEFFKLAPNN